MLRGGLTLLTGLQSLSKNTGRTTLRRVWAQTAVRIQEGASLAGAMAEAKCFPDRLVQLVGVYHNLLRMWAEP